MNGTSIASTGSPAGAATDWTIEGVGDFNGDGKADILWRHTSGSVAVWLMNGTTIIGRGSPASVAPKSDIRWTQRRGRVVTSADRPPVTHPAFGRSLARTPIIRRLSQ